MNQEIKVAVEALISALAISSSIQTINQCIAKIKDQPVTMNQIEGLTKTSDKYELIALRQELYTNPEVKALQQSINQLNLIILAINQQLSILNPVYICKKDT